ncbi:MAG: hypothetical protein R2795_17480 [Saprospiraceae bacterium]
MPWSFYLLHPYEMYEVCGGVVLYNLTYKPRHKAESSVTLRHKSTKDMDARLQAFGRLLKIMDELREQCPWDRKQTLESLRNLTIEETYELADAILEQDLQG